MSSLIIQPSPGDGVLFAPAVDKRAESISGGPGWGFAGIGGTVAQLSHRWDEAQRRYGRRIYEWMDRDPIAGGSVDVLKRAALASEPVVSAKAQPEPGRPLLDSAAEADAAKGAEIAELCTYALERLATPILPTLAELLDAMKFGSSLAGLVWEVVPRGKFAGKLVPRAIKPKAAHAWTFAVDPYFNVKSIVATTPSGQVYLPAEKFLILTWGGRGGDPRGASIFERAAEPWNLRSQIPRQHFLFLQRFGSPIPVGTLSDEQGAYTGLETDAAGVLLATAQGVRNGQAAVLAPGEKLDYLEPKSDGKAFDAAMELYRREIVLSILLQARVTMEAQNGSKADSETSENLLGNLIRFIVQWYSRAVEWQVLYRIALYNYGPDDADRLTPCYRAPEVEHFDLSDRITALNGAGLKMYRSQQIPVWTGLGIPAPTQEEIDAEEEASVAAAQALAGGQAVDQNATAPADGSQADQGGKAGKSAA